MTSNFETIIVEDIRGVRRITLNDPARHNPLGVARQREIVAAVEEAAEDDALRVVVLRGAGPSFSSGYDLGGAARTSPSVGEYADAEPAAATKNEVLAAAERISGTLNRWLRIWNARIPVIAQVHGNCLAGGTDLAQHCDLILAAEDATIGFTALRMGGVPPTMSWIYNVGPQWAKRLMLTGDVFTGRLAKEIGFALDAVPSSELDARVMALAERIVLMGPDIVALNKLMVNHALDVMGRRTVLGMAPYVDAIANQSVEMSHFSQRAKAIGLRAALHERDEPFAQMPIERAI